jgi:hypothetical protein
MSRRVVAALVVAAAAALGTGTGHATTAADICGELADPCELASEVTVTAGSVLDFGDRAFVIRAPGGRLQVGTGDILAIAAGSVRIESGTGGRLRTAPGSGGSCSVQIVAARNVDFVRVAGQGVLAVDLSSDENYCELRVTAGGDVTVGADVRARGTGFADGGIVSLSAGGRVAATQSIEADGAFVGGVVEISAVGPVELGGPAIDVSSTEIGLGAIEVLSETADVTIATKLDLHGKGVCADGGFLGVSAAGDVTLTGSIAGNGSGSPGEGGCSGAQILLQAGRNVVVNGTIDAAGAAPDGIGALPMDVSAGADFVQNAPIRIHGNGTAGSGGEATITAAGRVVLNALFDLNGGPQGLGGILLVHGGAGIEVASEVRADGANGSLSFTTAAEAAPRVGGRITVGGSVHARSSAPDPDFAGQVRLEACQIEVGATARIETSGLASRNLLRASDTMIVAGTLEAGTGTNELQYLDPAKPPQVTGTVLPPPVLTSSPPPGEELRPCPCTVDPATPGILCADDGNPCTQEVCDAALGCTHARLAGEGVRGCDDANVCNGPEQCVSLACTAGTPPPADDGDPCTDDGPCDPAAGYPRTPKTGLGAAACRMARIDDALASAAPGDILVKASRRIGKLAATVARLIAQAEGASGKRRARLLGAAAKKSRRLERSVASPRSGIVPDLAQRLGAAVSEARATLSDLTAGRP